MTPESKNTKKGRSSCIYAAAYVEARTGYYPGKPEKPEKPDIIQKFIQRSIVREEMDMRELIMKNITEEDMELFNVAREDLCFLEGIN